MCSVEYVTYQRRIVSTRAGAWPDLEHRVKPGILADVATHGVDVERVCERIFRCKCIIHGFDSTKSARTVGEEALEVKPVEIGGVASPAGIRNIVMRRNGLRASRRSTGIKGKS